MPLRTATSILLQRDPVPEREASKVAFTLFEVMVVLLILGILLGLVVGLSRHARETAARAKAVADLGEIHQAVEAYHARFEMYPLPSSSEPEHVTNFWEAVPAVLENAPRNTLREYLPADFTAIDPWGAPYWYHHDATNAPLSYRLFSTGPNPRNPDPHARIFFQP